MNTSPFFTLRDALCDNTRRAVQDPNLPIIEVILFPDFNHAPLLRVDGTGMSIEDAARIEAAAPLAIVRLPEFARLPSPQQFATIKQKLNLAEPTPGNTQTNQLENIAFKVASANNIDLSNWLFWEIEITDNNITARFVTSSASPRDTIELDGIIFEFVTTLNPEQCNILLAAFDYAKQNRKPFFPFLSLFTK